jgi:hypothetical protein
MSLAHTSAMTLAILLKGPAPNRERSMPEPSAASGLAVRFCRVRSLIQARLPGAAPFLPGAAREEIERLGSALGFPVPAELAELLHICGGQDDSPRAAGPINHQHFLTVDEIIAMHSMHEPCRRRNDRTCGPALALPVDGVVATLGSVHGRRQRCALYRHRPW